MWSDPSGTIRGMGGIETRSCENGEVDVPAPDPIAAPGGVSQLGEAGLASSQADASPPGAARLGPAGRMDRVIGVLDRVVPWARVARATVTTIAAAAAGAVAVFAVAAIVGGPELNEVGWFAGLVLVAVLLLPSFALVGLRMILSTVIGLPERLRNEPGLRRDQIVHLAALAAGSDPRTGEEQLSRPKRGWRAARVLVSARGDLLEYALVLRVLSLPYLVLSFGAALGALAEIALLPLIALAFVLL